MSPHEKLSLATASFLRAKFLYEESHSGRRDKPDCNASPEDQMKQMIDVRSSSRATVDAAYVGLANAIEEMEAWDEQEKKNKEEFRRIRENQLRNERK